jgi:methionine biosynthesis protein MetW
VTQLPLTQPLAEQHADGADEFTAPTQGVPRPDFAAIAEWVKPGAKVLDLGCGDGSLLGFLRSARNVHGYGVEIDDLNVLACFSNGVNVIQSDLESGLQSFES